MPRLFIGLKCAEQKYLAMLQWELRKILPKSQINWVDPANFHITLKFLGDVEDYHINPITKILDNIAHEFRPINLIPNQVGTFGPKNRPHVIWFGYKEDPILTALQLSIDKALASLGFEPEKRKFSPHLTLGRVKQITEMNELDYYLLNRQQPIYEKFHVGSFQLIESILKQEGPEYKVIKQFQPET
jgi:2'-5' RNA ligase